jgi:glycosyltransferase involved in cell wall biosynthesis
MKVGFFVENFTPDIGGTYSVVRETISALSKHQIKISIITSSYKDKNKQSYTNIIKKLDICHFYGGWSFFHFKYFLLSLKLKKKIIIHPLGFYEPWSLCQKKIKKKIAWFFYQKKILQKANLVHCASNKEEINLLKINKNCKTITLPYGISDSFINRKKIKKNKIKKRAIFFSRLHKKKGIEFLLKAWNEINHPEWKLDIVGPKDNNSYYKKLIKLKKFNSKINFLNPVYSNFKKMELFNKYDFFILPSFEENFGLAILESLARGLPVLTNINTPWNEIKTYNAGWYIKDDYYSLKKTLTNIFNTKISKLYQKKVSAIKLAKMYSWNILSKKYLKVYSDLLNKK